MIINWGDAPFKAFITVTYPCGTCTVSLGDKILTHSGGGTTTFAVNKKGTWTVKCSYNTITRTTDVSITSLNESKSVTISYDFVAFAAGAYKDIASMSNASVSGSAVVITATSANDTDKCVWSSSNITVNVTDYKTLRINARWENNDGANAVYRYAGVGLTKSKMSNGSNIYTPSASCAAYKQFGGLESGQTVGYATYNINVSSLSGNYYISAYTTACNRNTILRLKDIRLIL